MKRVITYGTFDLLHYGHINILKRAKELGDYLIVGVTSEEYDILRGKLNVTQSLSERIRNIQNTGLADEITVETHLGQKIEDIQKHKIDVFVIGSDWLGKFDYLKPYCEVVYIDRTKNISSTQLRNKNNKIISLGIVGNGRIANRFVTESKFVSGINITSVYGRNRDNVEKFKEVHELENAYTDFNKFIENVDAVYIALPHNLHYIFTKNALKRNVHVLCEKPFVLSVAEAKELYNLADEKKLILREAVKTAYAPCFEKLVNYVKAGVIGEIRDIQATFTKLIEDKSLREWKKDLSGGAMTELSTYPLCVIAKLLGITPEYIRFRTFKDENGVDYFTKVSLDYRNATANAYVGIGVKKEGDCVISGTTGYIYVPAPWWKTEFFEIKFEDFNRNKKVFVSFEGDGLRYEIAKFIQAINGVDNSYLWSNEESEFVSRVIEEYINSEQ